MALPSDPAGSSISDGRSVHVGDIVDVPGYENGRFVVGRVSAGGMGVVYQLYPAWIDLRPVALKTFKAVENRVAFEREVALWVQISGHPNIAEPMWNGYWQSMPAVVSLWYPGQLSSETIADLGAEEVSDLFRGIVAGLEHAYHEHGVLHRDIKPANILVDRDGVPKVTDWGIASIASRASPIDGTQDLPALRSAQLTSAGLSGSPAYMAPELFAGSRPSVQTEIYALGVSLFEVLSGEHPYAGPETSFRLTSTLRMAALDHLGEAMRMRYTPLLRSMLSLDPDERPRTFADCFWDRDASSPAARQTADAAIARARFLREAGHFEQAISHLQQALVADPEDPALWNALAMAFTRTDSVAAESALGRAVTILRRTGGERSGRTYPDPVMNMFRFALRDRRFEEAADLLRLARSFPERGGSLAGHYHETAWLDLWEGRTQDAARQLADYCTRRPLTIREPLEWLLLASLITSDAEMTLNAPLLAELLPQFASDDQHALLVAAVFMYLNSDSKRRLWATVTSDNVDEAHELMRRAGLDPSELGPPPTDQVINMAEEMLDVWTTGGRLTPVHR